MVILKTVPPEKVVVEIRNDYWIRDVLWLTVPRCVPPSAWHIWTRKYLPLKLWKSSGMEHLWLEEATCKVVHGVFLCRILFLPWLINLHLLGRNKNNLIILIWFSHWWHCVVSISVNQGIKKMFHYWMPSIIKWKSSYINCDEHQLKKASLCFLCWTLLTCQVVKHYHNEHLIWHVFFCIMSG